MILPITTYTDEVLHQTAKPLKGVDGAVEELIDSMFESMENASGIGLAAPQVGHSLRLLVLDISCMKSYEDVAPMVVINPHILSVKGKNLMEEGCLSVPGVQGDVQRPSSITLKYRDRNFLEQTEEFSGMLARVLQHEIDHLSGTLFIDRMEKRDRRKIQKELDDIAKGNIEVDYPLARACSRDGGGAICM
ncbi:peptide deformylase [Chlorobium phaeovibrioides]|uniref:Peptide deformylase n=2 Tax=Chlorobium phaeovibrioides TaxID=1094 RepID=DEF_CHLPM|nr:peptide deformylase [Chlorobium phaeovibrioides]A4SFP2.1 RecName: Full=Peptide deformylase; Short=PDF; AltName: Full=Polypeptide deformylase [Chlorobium phaeovibrioides DSM 265]KAA6232929.1 peptide deformylase [Chlorobium phaeovibrioides]HCD36395.1 peptide deformylase [Chlorobium sp.]